MSNAKRFYVKNNGRILLLKKVNGKIKETYYAYSWLAKDSDKEPYKLTEEEIKGFDERYWPFREEV